jgi:hypothetical protein
MAQPLGSNAFAADQPSTAAPANTATSRGPVQAKKKGCKQRKCSHWKGGKCRCGRD